MFADHSWPAKWRDADEICVEGVPRLARLGESYRKAFDALGIDKVRRLTGNATLAGEKLEQALLWIGEKDAEEQRALKASVEIKMAEQIRLAHSAQNAAKIAAICAVVAAVAAIIALLKG